MAKLNDKQRRFAEEYIVDLNATQAAIRAGYSKSTAKQQGSRLLTNDDLQQYVAELKAQRSKRVQIDADYVLKRLFQLESFDLRDMYDAQGRLLPPEEWPEGAGQVISGVKVSKTILPGGRGEDDGEIETKEVKTESRNQTLKLMGEHVNVKAFDKTVKVEVPKVVKKYLGKVANS